MWCSLLGGFGKILFLALSFIASCVLLVGNDYIRAKDLPKVVIYIVILMSQISLSPFFSITTEPSPAIFCCKRTNQICLAQDCGISFTYVSMEYVN